MWISNYVHIKKFSIKWWICIEYFDLKRVFHEDTFPLAKVAGQVDKSFDFTRFLSDTYYSIINTDESKRLYETSFMTKREFYLQGNAIQAQNNIHDISFLMMIKFFKDHIRDMLEFYIDEVIVKFGK